MPMYEFLCPVCKDGKFLFEDIVKYDTEATECPECGSVSPRAGIEVPARRNPQHGLQK